MRTEPTFPTPLTERLKSTQQRLANILIERRLCAARLMTYEAEVADLLETEAALRRAIDGAAQPQTGRSTRRLQSRRP